MDDNRLSSNHQDNVKRLGQSLGFGRAFDIDTRDLVIHDRRLTFFYAAFLIDTNQIGSIISGLLNFNEDSLLPNAKFIHQVINNLSANNVTLEKTLSGCSKAVLNAFWSF